ncbi:MAG: N-acetyltransferase, partial [Prevotella sp.]|nr:N-acetyltransferase [Prevotella sp.]
MKNPPTIPEKYVKISQMIEKRYNLHVRKFTKKDVFQKGYGRKIFELINTCFKDLYGYSELSPKQIDQYIDMYFPLADLSLITGVEDWNKQKELIAIGISIPSLSIALQKCRRGRLLPFGWWHLIRALKFHKTKGIDLLLMGVLPEYRVKGANALMFTDLLPRYKAYGFEWGESQVEMETNENVQSQWEALEPRLHKRRRCYKKDL